MPGRVRTNFRSGNIAESLGSLLLKPLATVAEVPRAEDVGIDVVANLLRRDEDGNSYAEDSFVVQLKSWSSYEIEYRGHELTWLLDQSQPMFIGRVSLQDGKIALYPTIQVNQAVFAMHARGVTIRFKESPHGLYGIAWNGTSEPDHADVWLPEPILMWTLPDLADAACIKKSYDVIKRFLAIVRRELDLLKLGQTSQLSWKVNDPESIEAPPGMMKSHPDSLQKLAEQLVPALQALLFKAATMSIEAENCVIGPLIALATELRKIGVDIDPSHSLSVFAARMRQVAASKKGISTDETDVRARGPSEEAE